jgi:hypothetical protein
MIKISYQKILFIDYSYYVTGSSIGTKTKGDIYEHFPPTLH